MHLHNSVWVVHVLLFRFLWLFLFLGAAGGFLYYFITGIQRYRSFRVITNVDYQSQGILEFPSVTICNYNLIKKSYVTAKNDPFYSTVVDYLDPFAPSDLNVTDPDTIKRLQGLYTSDFGLEAAHHKDMLSRPRQPRVRVRPEAGAMAPAYEKRARHRLSKLVGANESSQVINILLSRIKCLNRLCS